MRAKLKTRPLRAKLPPVHDNWDAIRQWTTRLAWARRSTQLWVLGAFVFALFILVITVWGAPLQYTPLPPGRLGVRP